MLISSPPSMSPATEHTSSPMAPPHCQAPAHPAADHHAHAHAHALARALAHHGASSDHDAAARHPSHGRPRDSVISQPLSPRAGSSLSSDPRRSSAAHTRRSSALDRPAVQCPPRARLDPEKHGGGPAQARASLGAAPGAGAVVYDQGRYHERAAEDKAWQLLFFLSGPCALLSAAIALWTVVALLLALALAPLRLCSTRPPLPEQLNLFLAPALNLQLHLVYSHDCASDCSTPMLLVIHLFSPMVAFGVAIAAWTAAAFWFFSSILGDPGGHDGHNDGQESILGVRKWWERWLSRGLSESSA